MINITKKTLENNGIEVIVDGVNTELVDKPIKQSNRRFLNNDLALKIIMNCRTDKSCRLKI